MREFCSKILRPSLGTQLADQEFDVAVIDLMFNECGLALANKLSVPSVGYWAFSFSSGVQVLISTNMPGVALVQYVGVHHDGSPSFPRACHDVKAWSEDELFRKIL